LVSTIIGAAMLVAVPATSSASTLGVDATSGVGLFFPFDTNIGWQFSVNAPITVDGLGMFDAVVPGLAGTHEVGLWDNSGTLLASTTVTNASTPVASADAVAGRWLFENIAPLALTPGTYVVGLHDGTAVDFNLDNPTFTTAPQITFLAPRLTLSTTFGEPVGPGAVPVFGANIRIQSPVPEPASMVLLGSGLGTLLLRRRRAKYTSVTGSR
jgi:hypothetical protein